jgi:hypothetical protein
MLDSYRASRDAPVTENSSTFAAATLKDSHQGTPAGVPQSDTSNGAFRRAGSQYQFSDSLATE